MITPLDFPIEHAWCGDGTWSSIARGRVFVADVAKIACFSTKTGRKLWSSSAPMVDRDRPYLDDPFTQLRDRALVTPDGSSVLRLQHHGAGFAVSAFDSASGARLWHRRFSGGPVSGRVPLRRSDPEPSGSSIGLYAARSGVCLIYESELFPLEREGPSMVRDRRALSSEFTEIVQLDPRTGCHQWERVFDGQLPLITAPACRLVLHDQRLCRIDERGRFRPRFEVNELPESVLTVAGRMAIAFIDGRTVVVGISTGDSRTAQYLRLPHSRDVFDAVVQGNQHAIAVTVNMAVTHVFDWRGTRRWSVAEGVEFVPLDARRVLCKAAAKFAIRDLAGGRMLRGGRTKRGRRNDRIWTLPNGRAAFQFGSELVSITARGPTVKRVPIPSNMLLERGKGRCALAWQVNRRSLERVRPVLVTMDC